MAACLCRVYTSSARLFSLVKLSSLMSHYSSNYKVDVIDDFTSQLMQRKIGKWDEKKRKHEALIESKTAKLENNATNFTKLENLTEDQIRILFQNLIESEDTIGVINLTRSCIADEKSPSVSLLVNILSICSQSGEKELIQQLQEMCKTQHGKFVEENSNFRDFLAQAIWIKGDISKALEIFEQVYRENAFLRRRIRLMFKHLVSDLVANGSEAALGNMINFSERILCDFHDFFPLACVWQSCFLSEWFADQKIALQLLEKHSVLCKSVINRIPYVVFVSLKSHRTEIVYRLLEILLKFQMKTQYSFVLGALLEYQFRSGDFKSCSEIISWSVSYGVPLPQKAHIQMINLILNQKLQTPLALLEQKTQDTKCDFKF